MARVRAGPNQRQPLRHIKRGCPRIFGMRPKAEPAGHRCTGMRQQRPANAAPVKGRRHENLLQHIGGRAPRDEPGNLSGNIGDDHLPAIRDFRLYSPPQASIVRLDRKRDRI